MRKYEFVVVGSGAGGSAIAKELAMRGKDVLILEKGSYENSFGTLQDIARFYDINNKSITKRVTNEGIRIYRAFAAGGTTIVSCGNGVRCLEKELHDLGICIEKEFSEAEKEMKISPLPTQFLSDASCKLKWAAESLGYRLDSMPKFIDFTVCKKCGKCIAGCPYHAKWSAIKYLDQALRHGASILYQTTVNEVIIKHGHVKGVVAVNSKNETTIHANTVIIAAGGFETPLILQRSGIKEAGKNLFLDLYVNTFGQSQGISQINEPVMTLLNEEFLASKGFVLSPFINRWKIGRFSEQGKDGLKLNNTCLVGFMAKIADSATGCIYKDGSISKPVTKQDKQRLADGSTLAKEIMIKAGVRKDSLVTSKIQGAHPGGTAAIGHIVDNNLQTNVNNLFVCDASVLPVAPGLPPILTITALAKRLGKTLTS